MSEAISKSSGLNNHQDLMTKVLKNPALLAKLSVAEWNDLLFQAYFLKLRSRLAHDAKDSGIWDQLPEKARQILSNAEITIAARQRRIMWEVNRVRRALQDFDGKVILVKGTAYIALGLHCAKGRSSVDVDILVARNQLDRVENYFLMAGYESHPLDEYDQKYYREWSHELPPLSHPHRKVEVDVHHTILQITNKLSPEIAPMIEGAVHFEDNIYTLCPEDMLLHSIVHQFIDGEIKNSLRNLLEQHDMFTEFSKQENFWQRFMDRTDQSGMGRAVFYSLRYCQQMLGTDVPKEVQNWMKQYVPNVLLLSLMDALIHRVMNAFGGRGWKITDYIASNMLYIRSHWLRMPPMMLFKHLSRKFFLRFKNKPEAISP